MALRHERTRMRDDALGCDALARALAGLGAFGGAATGMAVGSMHYGMRFTPRRMGRSFLLGAAAGSAGFALWTHLMEPNCSRTNRQLRGEPISVVQRVVDWVSP